MEPALTPPSRPRRGAAIVLAVALVLGVVTVASVVGTPDRAEASGLETFRSCGEIAEWGRADQPGQAEQFSEVGAALETQAAPTTGAPMADDLASTGSDGAVANRSTGSGPADEAATGATNVVVEGVDELDVIDRLGDGLLLAVGPEALVVVDLDAAEVVASRPVPGGSQVTYDDAAAVAWVVGSSADGSGVQVERVRVGDGTLDSDGRWTTSGVLVDARRVGDRLHVVATDGFVGVAEGDIPFADGPVPCDQVLHPTAPSDPSATLLVTLPAEGELEPTHATQVVGSGSLVHVTTDAAYLATPDWSGASPTTGIHRFELDDLAHTGSGTVAGSLLNDFSMSEHDGHLRVAVSMGGGGVIGRPMPVPGAMVEPGFAGVDDAVSSSGSDGAVIEEPASDPIAEPNEPTPSEPVPVPEPTVPDTTVPDTTVPVATIVPEPTPTEPVPTTEPAPIPEPGPSVPLTVVPEPEPQPGDALNEIVVLDTEGDLDVVGRTERFGLPGESIFGIRFDGEVAYAVTFLQTDPFYVVDLADPTEPQVVGEVKLPGFSGYLHPVGDGHVVGFGPGADGRAAAKLFDVSDRTKPAVVDEVVLGDESAVTSDHHAFTSLGEGRFAVPVSTWGGAAIACPPDALCEGLSMGAAVVELEVDGDSLVERDRTEVTFADGDVPQRALRHGDGWAVVGTSSLVLVAGEGQTAVPLR